MHIYSNLDAFIEEFPNFLHLKLIATIFLCRKTKKQRPELFSFMHPLSLDVWIYIVVAYFIVSFLLFILARSII